MIFPLLLGIALGAVAVVFALQNVAVTTVSFFDWTFQGSLALIILASAGMGILVSLLIVMPESISNYFSYRSLKKENAKLEEELRKQKELTVFAKKTPASPEMLAHIDKGAIADPRS